MELQNFTIKQINRGLKAKEFSAKELTLAYFDKIKKTDNEIIDDETNVVNISDNLDFLNGFK
jgi:Asp-tRNA(Asn)/Glu-tRNA(Gln) amidotransferase A subunit family amidase